MEGEESSQSDCKRSVNGEYVARCSPEHQGEWLSGSR